jgi:hypothetical protein
MLRRTSNTDLHCRKNMKKANNRGMPDEQSVNVALRSLVGIVKAELRHAN